MLTTASVGVPSVVLVVDGDGGLTQLGKRMMISVLLHRIVEFKCLLLNEETIYDEIYSLVR